MVPSSMRWLPVTRIEAIAPAGAAAAAGWPRGRAGWASAWKDPGTASRIAETTRAQRMMIKAGILPCGATPTSRGSRTRAGIRYTLPPAPALPAAGPARPAGSAAQPGHPGWPGPWRCRYHPTRPATPGGQGHGGADITQRARPPRVARALAVQISPNEAGHPGWPGPRRCRYHPTRPATQRNRPRWPRSFQVANTNSARITASPARIPYSCARGGSGFPRIASAR